MKQLLLGMITFVLVTSTLAAPVKTNPNDVLQTLPNKPMQVTDSSPPGLAKQDAAPAGLNKQGKTPAGWSHGKKKGWSKTKKTKKAHTKHKHKHH